MLQIGTHAPEFTLPADDGTEVSLTTLLNRGPLLLYFYAADFAPPCTRHAEAISRIVPQLQTQGLVVAGISPQSAASHERFRRRFHLQQALLADETKAVSRMFDAVGPLGLLVRRAIYLIDQGRIIRGALVANFRIAPQTRFMLEARPRLDAIAAELRRRSAAA